MRFLARWLGDSPSLGDLAALRAENALLRDQVEYWRSRAELLLDADRVGRGQAPVMATLHTTQSPLGEFRGLSMTEVPTRRKEATSRS